MKTRLAPRNPAAERDREKRRRAVIMTEDELRRETRDLVVSDAEALVTTPAYTDDDFVDDLRRYVGHMKLWHALRDLGGKVRRGDFDDAVAVWYHEKGGKFSDIATRVLAGEFADHDRYESLNLRWPDDDD